MGTSVGESLDGADFDGVDDDDEFPEAHEINVTPFIDVMLVLLIIFMVAAPLSTVDLPVDLPSSTASPQKNPDKPLYGTIKPDLSVGAGHHFGVHVDNAVRGDHLTGMRLRTDLSVTLFLSEPDEYDGGELIVEDLYGSHAVKLPAGDMVLS